MSRKYDGLMYSFTLGVILIPSTLIWSRYFGLSGQPGSLYYTHYCQATIILHFLRRSAYYLSQYFVYFQRSYRDGLIITFTYDGLVPVAVPLSPLSMGRHCYLSSRFSTCFVEGLPASLPGNRNFLKVLGYPVSHP